MAKNEPLMAQEKIINDDGTPSDYLIRWLRSALGAGEKTVKFPVTSVNGMTGDVVIDINDLINFEIDYDYINERIQQLIYELDTIRQYIIQRFIEHIADYHKYAFQGFMSKAFGDDRMFSYAKNRSIIRINAISISVPIMEITTADIHGLSANASVTIEDIENSNVTNALNKIYTVDTIISTTKFEVSVPAGSAVASLNTNARLVLNDPPNDAGIYNPPIYFPSCATSGPATPGPTSFWNNTNFFSDRNKRRRTFGLFVVEKTMRVKRLYIPIRGNTGGSGAPTLTNYAMHQFGIFSCGYASAVLKESNIFNDVPMRYPNKALWQSEVLDTRGLLYYSNSENLLDAEPWPNAVGVPDAVRNGLTSYAYNNGALQLSGVGDGLYCLSWNMDFLLPRGVYFLGLQTYGMGAGSGTGLYGDLITPIYAAPVATSDLLPQIMNRSMYSSASGNAREMAAGSLVAAVPRFYNFTLTDQAAYGSSWPDFSDTKLLAYLQDNSIKPLLTSTSGGNPFYTENGTDIGFSFIPEAAHPCVGFAGTFADVQPPDIW